MSKTYKCKDCQKDIDVDEYRYHSCGTAMATSEAELAEQLRNPNIPKTEREHYAQRRISQLEEAIRWAANKAFKIAMWDDKDMYPLKFVNEIRRRAGLDKEEGK